MHERKLMVRQGHRDYSLKTKPNNGNPSIPFILLKGSWLEKSGFAIGLSVTVQVSHNQLTITPR